MIKINLLYGAGDILHTHININPFAEEEIDGVVVRANIKNLDYFVEDAEADEIIATDVIDFLPLTDVSKTLDNWTGKLRHGGTIIIGGIDMFEVCKAFSQYRIGITEANQLIHGEQTKSYLIRRWNSTTMGLTDYFASRGLEIQKKRINNFKMILEAKRP